MQYLAEERSDLVAALFDAGLVDPEVIAKRLPELRGTITRPLSALPGRQQQVEAKARSCTATSARVRSRRTHLGPSVGSYGWPGKYGIARYNDPAEDVTTIFIMQRAHAATRPSVRTSVGAHCGCPGGTSSKRAGLLSDVGWW
jgi:hypothetical protein